MNKINWKKATIYALCCLAFITIIFFSIKNVLFSYIIQSKIDDFNEKYYTNVQVQDIKFKGISQLALKQLLVTLHNDTICTIDTLQIQFNPLKAIIGEVNIKQLFLKNMFIKYYKTDTSSTFQSIFKTKLKTIADTTEQKIVELNKRAQFLFKILFNLLPYKGELENINFYYFNNKVLKFKVLIPYADVENSFIKLPIFFSDDKNVQTLALSGIVNSINRRLQIKCVGRYNPESFFPGYTDLKLKAHFDTAMFSIEQKNVNNTVILKGTGQINKFLIYQPLFSFSEIEVDMLKMNYEIKINENTITLDSTSLVVINNLPLHPFIQYQVQPEKKLKIRLNEPKIDANKFFASLPYGLFPNTSNIKASGNLQYRLNFEIYFNNVESLKLESELLPKNLKIFSYGNLNISKLDSDFVHIVYEKGNPVENIFVSYSNPNYVPFASISPYLKNALLCTEDGAFFRHRGFIQEAFIESMIENLKRKRFVRGGSTITMQLVKNLYLNRYKVISRKLEEMLIVWLIENLRLASKERMFELYLNIIEFGPLVYGISKGSYFYFQKKPAEISLPEAIFLASIVPKPKHFVASFDSTGNLKPQTQDFLKFVAKKMYQKQMISEQEFLNFVPHVELKGKAKDFVLQKYQKSVFEHNQESNVQR